MAIKMVVVDLDGTALKKDHSIAESTIEAFKRLKENNIMTAIATGRLEYESMFVKEALGIDYMITGNGSIIYDYTKNHLVYNNNMKNENAIAILEYVSKYKDAVPLMFVNEKPHCIVFDSKEKTKKRITTTTLSRYYIESFEKYFDYTSDYKTLLGNENNKVHKICLDATDDKEALKDIVEMIKTIDDVKSIPVTRNIIDIMQSKSDKGSALQILANYLDIKMKDIMSIGDSYNDVDMIKFSGIGIAMGNSKDVAKYAANYIVASNNEDGIFEAIDKYVFVDY